MHGTPLHAYEGGAWDPADSAFASEKLVAEKHARETRAREEYDRRVLAHKADSAERGPPVAFTISLGPDERILFQLFAADGQLYPDSASSWRGIALCLLRLVGASHAARGTLAERLERRLRATATKRARGYQVPLDAV